MKKSTKAQKWCKFLLPSGNIHNFVLLFLSFSIALFIVVLAFCTAYLSMKTNPHNQAQNPNGKMYKIERFATTVILFKSGQISGEVRKIFSWRKIALKMKTYQTVLKELRYIQYCLVFWKYIYLKYPANSDGLIR